MSAVPSYVPTNNSQGFQFLHILAKLFFFNNSHRNGYLCLSCVCLKLSVSLLALRLLSYTVLMFSFSLISWYFLISLVISSLTHGLYECVLQNFKKCGNPQVIFLFYLSIIYFHCDQKICLLRFQFFKKYWT